MIEKVVYTVTATLPDEATAAEYVAWLVGGHVQAVIAAGAERAEVARLTEPPAPARVESRYLFSDRAAYERYIREHAPALRAEGLSRFPPTRGVTMERRVGVMKFEASRD